MRVADVLAALEALPLRSFTEAFGARRALVLAPHADDESLGCGGLIATAVSAGVAPQVVILTDGAASHPGSRTYPPDRLAALREAEAAAAVRCLGLDRQNLHFLRFPDTRLPAAGPDLAGAVARLQSLGEAAGCGVILAPWAHDPHCDHEAAARIAAALAARTGWPLFSYPVWGWLRDGADELPDGARITGFRLDIGAHLAAKQAAIAAHASQYTELITDSPDGFRLPPDLLAVFSRPYEVFVQ